MTICVQGVLGEDEGAVSGHGGDAEKREVCSQREGGLVPLDLFAGSRPYFQDSY